MNVLIFEDPTVSQLNPITTGRPAYAISCAGYRLIDWIERLRMPITSVIRPHLRTIQSLDYPHFEQKLDQSQEWTLVVNSRIVPGVNQYKILESMTTQASQCVIRNGWSLAAAVIPTKQIAGLSESAVLSTLERIELPQPQSADSETAVLPLLQWPHDVIRYHMQFFDEGLQDLIQRKELTQTKDGVFLAEGATLGEYVITNTSAGPIVLDRNAKIGPHCYLNGPVYIGPNSRVIEHSAIKDSVYIGHTTKIGGEVEASIIEPYTNKQHHGFLGHSYLGSWINLGAGTCNSDLKNTYGEVKMEYRNEKVPTGMQFIGCIMGDYAKTAINTGIFTGKTIGTCSMVYGFVTRNVPSFVNYARLFGQVTELPPGVMVSTQERMFKRRNVQQRPCDIQLIHDMYGLTRDERQLAEEPLVL